MSTHVYRLAATVARTTNRIVDRLTAQGFDGAVQLRDVRLPWYEVRADTDGRAVGTEADATVFIFDEIGGSLGIQASELVQEIEAITAPHIKVRINSPGGSVFDALAIYNALNHHPARVTTYVDALAASAATIIAMAGDEVVMMPGSQMMIHDASAMEDGNADDHRRMGLFLDRQSDNIAGIYARRTGDPADEWRLLMLDETWAMAAEAVEMRLADRVEDPPLRKADADLEERMQRRHDLSHFRYAGRANAPEPRSNLNQRRIERRAQRAEVTERPTAPADNVPDRAQAALARRGALERATATSGHPQARSAATIALGTDERRLPFSARLSTKMTQRDGKSFHVVEGYASVFDTPYAMWDEYGPYDEVVIAGAADQTLRGKPHVVFLANHGGLALASTRNGTLELTADRTGLYDVAYLNPERSDVNDLVTAIKDETIEEQSFAFYITDGTWNADFTRYEIHAFDLNRGDVSAVNYGANPHTTIAARQRQIFDELRRMSPAQQRAAARVLRGVETDDVAATEEVLHELVKQEVSARLERNPAKGTSLAHRWATLMHDLDE